MKNKPVKSIYWKANEGNINDLYYDAMELLEGSREDAKRAEKLLIQARELDEHSVQTYIGFTHVYGALKNKKKANECIQKAYDKTIRKFPAWPRRMEWGYIDNRAYLRAIQYQADLYADEREKDKAIELYQLLLRLNPNDNQGVRYTLAGVYAGISGEEVNRMFDECNEEQSWDALELLVQKQNALHHF